MEDGSAASDAGRLGMAAHDPRQGYRAGANIHAFGGYKQNQRADLQRRFEREQLSAWSPRRNSQAHGAARSHDRMVWRPRSSLLLRLFRQGERARISRASCRRGWSEGALRGARVGQDRQDEGDSDAGMVQG